MNFVFKFTNTKRTIFLTNDLPHNKYCLSWLWDNNTNVVCRPCTTLLDGRDWFHTTLRQAVFMINGLSMKPIIFVITWKKRCHLRLLSHLTEPFFILETTPSCFGCCNIRVCLGKNIHLIFIINELHYIQSY